MNTKEIIEKAIKNHKKKVRESLLDMDNSILKILDYVRGIFIIQLIVLIFIIGLLYLYRLN